MGSTAHHREPGQTHLTVSPAKGLVRALSNRRGAPLKAVIPGVRQTMTLVISQAGLTPAEPFIACRALPVVLLESHEGPPQSAKLERQQDA